MANTLTLTGKKVLPHSVIWQFKCQLSGSYVNSGATANQGTPGETLNFNGALNPNYIARPRIPNVLNGSTSALPKAQDFKTFLPLGYEGNIEVNATAPTAANFVLRIFAGGSGAATPAELASGTYASVAPSLTADPFLIEVQAPLKYC